MRFVLRGRESGGRVVHGGATAVSGGGFEGAVGFRFGQVIGSTAEII